MTGIGMDSNFNVGSALESLAEDLDLMRRRNGVIPTEVEREWNGDVFAEDRVVGQPSPMPDDCRIHNAFGRRTEGKVPPVADSKGDEGPPEALG